VIKWDIPGNPAPQPFSLHLYPPHLCRSYLRLDPQKREDRRRASPPGTDKLEKARFGHAHHLAAGDYAVIDDPDPDHFQRADDLLVMTSSAVDTSATPLGCGCTHSTAAALRLSASFTHLAGIDGCAVDRAPEELHELDEAMSVVQKHDTKRLELACAELHRQEVAHRLRRGECGPAPGDNLIGRGRNEIAETVDCEECFRLRPSSLSLFPGRACPELAKSTPQRRGHRLAAGDSASSTAPATGASNAAP